MTTLEAVNEILAGLGEPPVTALDTNGTSEQAEAEAYLNKSAKKCQRAGWSFNKQRRVTLLLPNRTVSCSGGSGTFTYGETVTQSTSGATGTFYYEEDGKVYLRDVSGTFDASHSITGGTSGATRNSVTATAAITSAKHAVPSTALEVTPSDIEWAKFSYNSGFLYDTTNNTYTFTGSVSVNMLIAFSFSNLPDWMQEYVAADASVEFQRYKRRGMADDALLLQELIACRTRARRADSAIARVNTNDRDGSFSLRNNTPSSILGRV